MDQQTQTLLVESLRETLGRGGGTLSAALVDLGWDEVLAEDPATATTLLFTEHGRALACSRALDDVLLAQLNPVLPPSQARRAVIYPLPVDADRPSSTGDTLDGLVLGSLAEIDELVIPARLDGGIGVALAPSADVGTERIDSFDREIEWWRVRGTLAAAPVDADGAWSTAVAAARRALAAEIVGASRAALAIAAEHTSSRQQFGHPVASFQAVRHRLAEAYVAVESVSSVLDAAWADGGAWSAAAAKAQAGRAQATISRHVLQVCGAVGLTAEHALHRYVTRTAVLDTLLGGYRDLVTRMGAELLGGAELSRVVELGVSRREQLT